MSRLYVFTPHKEFVDQKNHFKNLVLRYYQTVLKIPETNCLLLFSGRTTIYAGNAVALGPIPHEFKLNHNNAKAGVTLYIICSE